MSYVDEVIAKVVEQNPSEPEFHQAVKEVLESLRVVIEANEEKYRKDALLERLVNPERQFKFRVPWVDDKGTGSGKYRIPCTVQQCNRTLQGRSPSSSVCKHWYHQIPWF